MKFPKLFLLSTSIMMLGACTEHEGHGGSVFRYFSVDNGSVVVHAKEGPDAIVTADGGLTIAGQSVPLSPEQKDLLQKYRNSVLAVSDQAIATGKAGAATGAQAVASVAKGLASGNPDQIDKEVNAKAAEVEAAADKLCVSLGDARSAQDALAASLPAFRSYATITADEVAHCHRK